MTTSVSTQQKLSGPRLQALLSRLDSLRTWRKLHLTLIAILWASLPPITVLFVGTLLDVVCKFGSFWRFGFFGLTVLSALAMLGNIVRTVRQRHSDESMAAMLESAHPEADNTLINAVQLASDPNANASFVEAVLSENQLSLDKVKASDLYSKGSLKRLCLFLPVVALLVLLPLSLSPQRVRVSLSRILQPWSELLPYANTLIVSLEPKTALVPRGEEVEIKVTLRGDIPKNAFLEWVPAPGAKAESIKMALGDKQDGGDAVFAVVSPPVFDNARFRVDAGDNTSNWHDISVDNPPGLVTWEAAVAPPAYTGAPNYRLKDNDDKPEILGGARIRLAGMATRPVTKAELVQQDQVIATFDQHDNPGENFKFDADIGYEGALSIRLLTKEGTAGDNPLPLTVIPDKSPSIILLDTPTKITVSPEETFAIAFQATDDYGVARVGLQRLPENASPEEVRIAEPEVRDRQFQGRFAVETATFNKNEPLRFRLWVEDETRTATRRRGMTPVIHVHIRESGEGEAIAKAARTEAAATSISSILRMQKDALRDTILLSDQAVLGKQPPEDRLSNIHDRQRKIRESSIELLKIRDALGGFGDVVAGLVNQEMLQAIEGFDAVRKATRHEVASALQSVVTIQTKIVAALSNLNLDSLTREQDHQAKADIFASLQNLIKRQRAALKDAMDAKAGQDIERKALARNQDQIAQLILGFQDKCLQQAQLRAGDDFSVQLRKAHDTIEEEKAFDKALAAAEELEEDNLDAAIEAQKETLKALGKALEILNQWRLSNFKKTIEDVKEVLADAGAKLGDMETKQALIAATVREMKANKNLDDEDKKKLEDIIKQHEEMADMIEKIANDLYQFPELPLCHELNSKMREVFEDVMQALDSEKSEAVEIAVQKEDNLLDAIRNTKERIEDVEMWLPDYPDHFIWNMESFDTDEMPEIPLVELPEELEDIVGELLEQDTQIDMQSQDTTGNNIIADAEMGWMVMDGPMPSFSAKGKTGNTRPNDNEMTGRSGSGREGQATGELVENHVKGYEGRKTHARRTADQLQKGMVTEDENSTMDARATGGGKLGGESETIGLHGNAPRRDLHIGSHGKNPKQLRKETEAIYASARMLYVNTGNLGEAVRELRGIENKPPELRDLGGVRKRVLRHLSDTQASSESGAVIPLPVLSGTKQGGQAAADTDFDKIADEYKPLVNNYFKSLDN